MLVQPDVSISTPNSITTDQVLSAVITISGNPGDPTPTGSVILTASTTLGGSGYTTSPVPLSGGIATVNIPAGTLAVGTYWLTPVYTPDVASSSTYMSASNIFDYISVTAPTPTFTVSGTALSVTPGATTGNTSTVTLTPMAGFTGDVALSATVTSSPAGAQYLPTVSFGATSPVAITGTGSVTATLTVTTTAPSNNAYIHPEESNLRWCGVSGASLAIMLLVRMRRRRLRCGTSMSMGLLLLALGGLSLGCGGNSNTRGGGGLGTPGTTAGNYTVTVTGTSGAMSVTDTITVTVR